MLETDPATFRNTPQGAFTRGPTWLLWGFDSHLAGLVVWGRPSAEDAAALVGAFPAMPNVRAAPFEVLVDAQHMHGVEPVGFASITSHLSGMLPLLNTYIRRVAVVLPQGWAGALVAGLQHVVAPAYAWQTFASLPPALGFLEHPQRAQAHATVSRLVEAARAESPMLHNLQAWLRHQVSHGGPLPTLLTAALELGVAARSLQRNLTLAHTTFSAELASARMAVAQELVANTQDKLDALATRLGFKSLGHFATQFKRWTGSTPTEYRAHVLKGPTRPR